MRKLLRVAPVALTLALALPASAGTELDLVANRNLAAVTVSNYGAIGNNFLFRSASFEYPLGSGYEHLVLGGLWIGAHATDAQGAFTGVTTAALDGPVGISLDRFTEFAPSDDVLPRRSSTYTSPYWSPDAVSHLDVIGRFDVLVPTNTIPNPEPHRPLGVTVRMESYQWTWSAWQDFTILRYVVRNVGPHALTDVHVGLLTELQSGPRDAYPTWPPASIGSPYGSWYRKALFAWDGPLKLLREHRCQGPPVPGSCMFEITPAWAGVKLLTPPADGQAVTVAMWNWSPGDPVRDQDVERYALMSAGTIANLAAPEFQPGVGDPIEVLALGPFASIAPGDSVEVAFALVGGAEVADIQAHALAAQALHDAGYVDPVVDVPNRRVPGGLALAPVANPSPRGGVRLGLEVPVGGGEAPIRLTGVDATGRRVVERTLSGLGPGRHVLTVPELGTASPGLYFFRVVRGAETSRARVVLAP